MDELMKKIFSLIIFSFGIMNSSFADKTEGLNDIVRHQVQKSFSTHSVGDSYAGGVIFWTNNKGTHGLIASKNNQNSAEIWGGQSIFVSAIEKGIYKGNLNTYRAIAVINDIYFAAKHALGFKVKKDGVSLCDFNDSTEECYGDWYLPSKEELDLMYQQRAILENITESYYWSSTEIDKDNSFAQHFGNGEVSVQSKSAALSVRLIRSF